jgi:hypothetical protein
VQRFTIGFREDRHRAHAQLLARTIDAQRDLTTVGNQNFTKNLECLLAAVEQEERLTVLHRRTVV